jgi:hypothetical protein
MTRLTTAAVHLSVLLVVLAGGLVLTSCDLASTSNTAILNANSPDDPTVEYTFFYETDGTAAIEVQSDETDNLSSILQENGFRRSDVVSARIDSVELERRSSPTAVKRLVFDYLAGATVYLGPDADGLRIAEADFQTTDSSITLPVRTANVTDVVKRGPSSAFLQLSTADDDVPDRQDRVAVTVYFRIEVRGV